MNLFLVISVILTIRSANGGGYFGINKEDVKNIVESGHCAIITCYLFRGLSYYETKIHCPSYVLDTKFNRWMMSTGYAYQTSYSFWGAAPYKRSYLGHCPSARKVEVVYQNCIERFNLTTDNALTTGPKWVFETDGTECSKCISFHKNKSQRSNSDSEDDAACQRQTKRN